MIIKGTYNKTIFRNIEDGYTIFSIMTKEKHESKRNGCIFCKGYIPEYSVGIPLRLTGEFVSNGTFCNFKVSNVDEYSDDEQATVNYLRSSRFKGIGPKYIQKILEITGADIFEFAQKPNAIELLSQIKGIPIKKIECLIDTIRSSSVIGLIYKYIRKFGGTFIQAEQLSDISCYNPLEEVKTLPYSFSQKRIYSFYLADSIAKDVGIYYLDRSRIQAILTEALYKYSKTGNTYSTFEELFTECKQIIKNSANKTPIHPTVFALELSRMKNVYIDEDSCNNSQIYLNNMWYFEESIANNLARLILDRGLLMYDESIIDDIEKANGISYSEKQRESFNFLKTTGLKILTGGPGTGKTTVIKGLIEAYKCCYPDNSIVLAAPTARAAQRLAQASGECASTIHKLLNIRITEDCYSSKGNEDYINADFIIIDEISMIDSAIFCKLLQSTRSNSLILLCGDSDQLPSVEAGNILHDLISSGKFETIKLDAIYRQAEGSNIIKNAILVNKGIDKLESGPDFQLVTLDTEEEMSAMICKLTKTYYNSKDPFSIQVLTTTKKYDVGTRKLNEVLQTTLSNNSGPEIDSVCFGTWTFNVGDKVIQTRNNYKIQWDKDDGTAGLGVFNGDIGLIKSINKSNKKIEIVFDDRIAIYNYNDLIDLKLAYAITIHKSQGSEFPVIIIVLPERPYNMTEKCLLYTAITRSSGKVFLITQPGVINKAVNSVSLSKRKTGLLKKINKVIN